MNGLGMALGLRRFVQNWALLNQKLNLPSANSDLVQWSSIDTIATDMTVRIGGVPTGGAYFEKYKPERISGNGTITQVKFHSFTIVGLESVLVNFWRKNTSNTYDLLYNEDILSKITAEDGIKTITLNTPQDLIEGDYVGFIYKAPTGGATSYCRSYGSNISPTVAALFYNTISPENPTDWDAKTNVTYKVTTHCIGQSPLIVAIGDSIMEGAPYHSSMISANAIVSPSQSWLHKLYTLDNRFVYQNVADGNLNRTSNFVPRFERDVVAKKPIFSLIEGGVNDLYNNVAKATWLSNMQSMIEASINANIIPIVFKILPWTMGTNEQLQTRDDWNTSLTTLYNSYTIDGGFMIDFSADMGQFRIGGDAGNLWDIIPAYDYDGVHFTEAGQAKMAEVVLREFSKKYRL